MDERLKLFNEKRACFEEFLRNTDQKKKGIEFLISEIKKGKLKKGNKIKILSIGAGLGEDLFGLLSYLKKEGYSFEFFYNDLSKISFDIFLKRAKGFGLGKNFSGSAICGLDDLKLKEKFDLVIASHVFYYLKNWKKSIKKISSLLSDDGKAYVILQSKHGHYNFRKKFIGLIKGQKYREYHGEEIYTVCRKMGIKCEARKVDYFINVKPAITRNNKINASGKKILTFLLRTDYDTVNEGIKKKIDKYLKEKAKSKSNKILLKSADIYTKIYKK